MVVDAWNLGVAWPRSVEDSQVEILAGATRAGESGLRLAKRASHARATAWRGDHAAVSGSAREGDEGLVEQPLVHLALHDSATIPEGDRRDVGVLLHEEIDRGRVLHHTTCAKRKIDEPLPEGLGRNHELALVEDRALHVVHGGVVAGDASDEEHTPRHQSCLLRGVHQPQRRIATNDNIHDSLPCRHRIQDGLPLDVGHVPSGRSRSSCSC